MNISSAALNMQFKIVDCHLDAELRERLFALGLIPGQKIQIVRKGFGGDPIQIRIGATEIMLRKQLADHIEITEVIDAS